MKLKVITGVVLTLFLMDMLALSSEAQVGVKAGDWIKYDYAFTGAPPAGTSLPTWMKVDFLSVEGTNATIRLMMHMSDGTEQDQTMTVSIGDIYFIPANCTAGDFIYINGNITIAGETTRAYAGARRMVVYASFPEYGTERFTYYWDKQTGVMVEISATSAGRLWWNLKATETNMWQAVPFWMQWWFWIIAVWAIAGIVVLAVVIYFLKKRKPPTPTAPSHTTEGTLQNIHPA